MPSKLIALYPCSPNTLRETSTKISASKDKVVYTNGKTVIIRDLENADLPMTFSGHAYNATVARFSLSAFYCAPADITGTDLSRCLSVMVLSLFATRLNLPKRKHLQLSSLMNWTLLEQSVSTQKRVVIVMGYHRRGSNCERGITKVSLGKFTIWIGMAKASGCLPLAMAETPIGRNDIVWVWNIIWFAPLDWIKFAMKATVIKKLRQRHEAAQAPTHHSRSDSTGK